MDQWMELRRGGGGVSRDPKELGEMVCAVWVAVGTS